MDYYILTTVLLLMGINLYGYFYSYLIVNNKFYNQLKIQSKDIDNETLKNRVPLVSFNVFVLIMFNIIGLMFFKQYFISEFISIPILIIEVLFVLFIDDLYFYFLHRTMHENKFIYRKIHKIHHRANVPIPIEYLYVHPLEWMSGMIGPFIGMLLIGGISFQSYLVYLIVRNIHEIHIHSGIKTSIIHKIFPLYGTNEHHDIHHSKRDGNYSSTFILWDLFFNSRLR